MGSSRVLRVPAMPRRFRVGCSRPLRLSFPGSAIKPATEGPDPEEAPSEGEWETVQLRGSWRAGQTAGGSRNFASYPTNPCFPLSVPEGAGPRCVRVTLRQHSPDSNCHPIGFHVFQASSNGSWEVRERGGEPGGRGRALQRTCVPADGRSDAETGTRSFGHIGQVGRSHTRLVSRCHETCHSLGSQVSSGSPLSTHPGSEQLSRGWCLPPKRPLESLGRDHLCVSSCPELCDPGLPPCPMALRLLLGQWVPTGSQGR